MPKEPFQNKLPDDSGDDGGSSDVQVVTIEEEVAHSFLEYAMSVIVSRALPDVRDGLKPVHRRILYSGLEAGLRSDRQHRKCAALVGDVMKKYHPHGDQAIYDALARLAQDFSTRYLLIDGQGNFGSIDGDAPAAQRYTECRLSQLAMEMVRDIDEETVDFGPNYDGYETEPLVLPARFPNLLANGSAGIAVGMATNIPPHNLGEVIDAILDLLEHPDIAADPEKSLKVCMKHIKGPDFPTGALIIGQQGIKDAQTTGRGSIKMRAVCEIEEGPKGNPRVIVTELPYQVNKARLQEKIAELVNAKDRKLEGIADLRDESSDRGGMRIVIDLKRNAVPQVVLNQLYKRTQLQDTFGVNMLALVDGVPRTLTIGEAIHEYITHQVDVIVRRTRFRLRKAEERSHILEGLIIALDHIDEIVALIRAAADTEEARMGLIARFGLTEIQAQHILDMPLRRLTALEQDKIREEHAELQKTIKELRAILKDPARVRAVIADELTDIKRRFADPRLTKQMPDEGELDIEDLIADEDLVISVSRDGYVKSVPLDSYKSQGRGGRGVKGA
ncbi:MAG: DNA topoisomerase (ATP-hydrolyzing), partial [Actinomycetota bacterium]